MPKKDAAIYVTVTEAERDQVKKLAQSRGYPITADYLRALIEADAAAQSIDFKFSVNRGGYRERLTPDE